MNGAITWEQFSWVFGQLVIVATLLIGIWRFAAGQMDTIKKDAATAIAALDADLAKTNAEFAAFKLQVATDYAKNGYIKDVETRLTDGLGKLTSEIHAMNSRIDQVLTTLVEQQQPAKRTRS